MPVYTNKFGLPSPLYALLGKEKYSRGDSRRSATQLIDSPRLVAIKEKYGEGVTDIADRVWALFGTAVHKLIEEGIPASEWDITEERLFAEVEGWKISGAIDLQTLEGRAGLIDWKVCAMFSLKEGHKQEWENQLNVLAYLMEISKDITVSKLQVGAIIRDWSRQESLRDPTYPRAPFHMVDIPLWSFAEREAYVHERVRLHQEAEMALFLGDEPEPCTPEEMWQSEDAWAVTKKGNKRASKVFDNQDQAEAFAEPFPGAVIEHRPGERKRCLNFCPAAANCTLAPAKPLEQDGFS